jgi:uncharacterized protein (DUF1015 family)
MEIRPFRGWRYSAVAGGDISKFIAPPYDILSASDKQALLAGDARNIVTVDLPHVPPKEVGPDSEYQAAANILQQWKRTGVLVQDTKPAIYAYEQTFAWAGRTYSRRAILCGVRATPLGEDVIPHEHTFAGPKADRLKLTQYTRMQLSPIFGFYSGAQSAAKTLWAGAEEIFPVQAQLGEVGEKLWPVSDESVIRNVSQSLRNVPVFIADGHHRYTTAMNYRDSLLASGAIDANHEANFVLFALVEQADPGLLILPTHRIIRGLGPDFSIEKLAQAAGTFTWTRMPLHQADLADTGAFLSRFGPTAMAFVGASRPSELWVAVLKDKGAMAHAAPDELPLWRELDVAILHKLIIEKALKPWYTGDFAIDYTPDAREVVSACGRGDSPLGACLQPTPLKAVEEIALAGATMPHKSTYFYPKLATGMVLKPLE